MAGSRDPAWKTSAARTALRAIYARVDAMLAPYSCDSSTECCHFGITGREPYVTPVELAEVELAIAARGLPTRAKHSRRSLPLLAEQARAESRPCPLLDDAGKCRIYDARPLGCRTFFCDRIHGDAKRFPRDEIHRAVRDLADLAARFAPRAPGARPFTKALRSSPRG